MIPIVTAVAAAYGLWPPPLTAVEMGAHLGMQAILDAIIQTGDAIPPEAAANLCSEFPVEGMIFFSRDGRVATPLVPTWMTLSMLSILESELKDRWKRLTVLR